MMKIFQISFWCFALMQASCANSNRLSSIHIGKDKIMKNMSINEVKELLIGKWILTTDDEFVIDIKEDEIIYFYNGKIDERNPIDFVFNDSLDYYKTKSNAFDFMKDGELHSMVELIEYANQGKDTVVNTIIYVDKNGMDLIGRNKSASFRKLK